MMIIGLTRIALLLCVWPASVAFVVTPGRVRNQLFGKGEECGRPYALPKISDCSARRSPIVLLKAEKKEDGEGINGHSSKNETRLGIGGAGGVSYNVNALKRNLVQETVRHTKDELWDLLESPTNAAHLEDRLASIVQVNPVSCTTDSNMLDGEVWSFAFQSRQSGKTLLDPTRFQITRKASEASSPRPSEKGTGRSYTATQSLTFHLEDVEDNEDPFVVDQRRMFRGLWEKIETYSVTSLTRKAISLQLRSRQWNFLGRRVKLQEEGGSALRDDDLTTRKLNILYLDSDLCIVSERGMNHPFRVFTTKGINHASVRRKVGKVASGVVSRGVRTLKRFVSPEPATSIGPNGQSLSVGGMEEDEEAWEGDEDPFLNLSADERQELIKKMKLSEVEAAGREQRDKAVNERKNYKNLS